MSILFKLRKSVINVALKQSVCFMSQSNGAVKLAYASFQNTNVVSSELPLIILHGLFGCKKNWESLGKAFAKTGRKVFTVDARNHGESPRTDSMDYHAMSLDMELLLHDLNIPKAIILGHSMGGKIAMTLALTKPELVERLIIEDISPVPSKTAMQSFPAYLQAMQGVTFDDGSKTLSAMRGSVDRQLKKTFKEVAVRSFILTTIEEYEGGFRWKINLDTIEKSFDGIAGFPDFQTSYQGETLFIGGGLSVHIKGEYHPEIHRLFPQAQIETIRDAGHWVHSEKPHDFLSLVLKFLKDPL